MRRMWGCEGLKHCGACILMEANQRNSVKKQKLMFPQLIHRVCFVVSFNEYLGRQSGACSSDGFESEREASVFANGLR